MDELAQVVRFHRKRAGLSRLALATLAGVGKTAVFDIERGKPTVRFETLQRVLVALNIALTWNSSFKEEFIESRTQAGKEERTSTNGRHARRRS